MTPLLDENTDIAAVFAAGASLRPIAVGLHQFVVVPDGYTLQRADIDALELHPRWATARPQFDDEASFVAYCTRYWVEGRSIAFADRNGGIKAIFDYHDEAFKDDAGDDAVGKAGRGEHVASFTPRFTAAWAAWVGANGRQLSQEQFLEFLEERMGEIAEPDGAELNEVVRFFRVKADVGFQSGQNLTNGTVNLVWTEDAAASGGSTGQLTVPTEFVLLLRPYRDKPEAKPFTARLRWRLSKPKVTFSFHLIEEQLQEYLDELNELRRVRVSGADVVPIVFGSRV